MLQAFYTPQLWRHLGQENASEHPGTVAQGWGADFVGTAAAVAYLNDRGACATAATVSRMAGQSAGTTAGKLRRLSSGPGSMLDATTGTTTGLGVNCDCPNQRTKHYRVSV